MNIESKDIAQLSTETASRKDSHLDLALQSQVKDLDSRFNYEPMMSAHPDPEEKWEVALGKKTMNFPIWISSMTGGTPKTNEVNQRLARAARKFGLGMGVGSARIAIEDSTREKDFSLRSILGDETPFYLNFCIAQIENFLRNGEIYKLKRLRDNLASDGFIIHVNPLQEWMQPEGDIIKDPPIETIGRFLNEVSGDSLIVKEVGQGFGPESMKTLLQLPLTAIEFAAGGGTNFSKLELQRNATKSRFLEPFTTVGHSAGDMLEILNEAVSSLGEKRMCDTAIISGGIQNFLDGYYYIRKSKLNALYGQASAFLRQALQSQEVLDEFVRYQTEGLLLARAYLKIKESK